MVIPVLILMNVQHQGLAIKPYATFFSVFSYELLLKQLSNENVRSSIAIANLLIIYSKTYLIWLTLLGN